MNGIPQHSAITNHVETVLIPQATLQHCMSHKSHKATGFHSSSKTYNHLLITARNMLQFWVVSVLIFLYSPIRLFYYIAAFDQIPFCVNAIPILSAQCTHPEQS